MTPGPAPEPRPETCAPPRHVGPIRVLRYWGAGGKYRSRVCDHCGLRWRERMLRFGRQGRSWRRAIVSTEDLDPPRHPPAPPPAGGR